MKLYGFPLSPNTRKVLAVSHHIGVPLDFSLVDLTKGQSRTPEYLAINPCGRTPTLVDGDFVLWESNAIMQYIAGKKPNSLWPEDARARADIARWQCWQLAHLNEGTNTLVFENFVKQFLGKGDPDPAQVKRGEDAFHRDVSVLDKHLGARQFLAGAKVTLADFSVAAHLANAGTGKMPIASYRNVQSWYARIEALPAWQESAPKR